DGWCAGADCQVEWVRASCQCTCASAILGIPTPAASAPCPTARGSRWLGGVRWSSCSHEDMFWCAMADCHVAGVQEHCPRKCSATVTFTSTITTTPYSTTMATTTGTPTVSFTRTSITGCS
ncbi:unnamed protein product, partial [Prorocentrum cordatum]